MLATSFLLPLAAFGLLSLSLVAIVFTYRTALVISRRSRADVWPRSADAAAEPGFIQRAHDAHKNCLETLPVLLVASLVAAQSPAAESLASLLLVIVGLRFAQSATHLVGTSHWLVFIRGLFFSGQLIGMAILLLQAWVA